MDHHRLDAARPAHIRRMIRPRAHVRGFVDPLALARAAALAAFVAGLIVGALVVGVLVA